MRVKQETGLEIHFPSLAFYNARVSGRCILRGYYPRTRDEHFCGVGLSSFPADVPVKFIFDN